MQAAVAVEMGALVRADGVSAFRKANGACLMISFVVFFHALYVIIREGNDYKTQNYFSFPTAIVKFQLYLTQISRIEPFPTYQDYDILALSGS